MSITWQKFRHDYSWNLNFCEVIIDWVERSTKYVLRKKKKEILCNYFTILFQLDSDEEVCARFFFTFTNDDLTHNVQKLVKGLYTRSFRDPKFGCVIYSAPQASTVKIPSVRN